MTEVIYVPGGPVYYDPDEDVVILDANLRDYPAAHDHVLRHELGHADPQNQSLPAFLAYEFRHDLEIYFSRPAGVQEFFEYIDDQDGPELKFAAGKAIRSLWVMAMQPLGWVYRTARGAMET